MLLTIEEEKERDRKFIEEEGPWNNGGKQSCLARGNISMTHDELAKIIGSSYQTIVDAGFVMVPKQWRDDVMSALSKRRP